MPHTVVTIRLSTECRQLLLDPLGPVAISAEIRTLLEGASWRLVVRPRPQREYLIDMLRLHAWQLVNHVGTLGAMLPPDDSRRAVYERCLEAIEAGIKRARAT